ncbi:MAG TPA: CvpA family protein [Ktedonobacteraceae bacterium]|jgi:uncharacterized membrane protein required for colicin V production
MLGSLSLVDLLFVVTIVLLVFNGLRNGLVFSLLNLLSLPIAFVVAWLFGPQLTNVLAANNFNATPLVSYVVLFFGTVFIVHILATALRGTVKYIPLVGLANTLLGGVVGFIEAWLLWVVLLLILGHFLQDVNQVRTLNINVNLFQSWQQFYNDAISNSLFARVNNFIIGTIPLITRPR